MRAVIHGYEKFTFTTLNSLLQHSGGSAANSKQKCGRNLFLAGQPLVDRVHRQNMLAKLVVVEGRHCTGRKQRRVFSSAMSYHRIGTNL